MPIAISIVLPTYNRAAALAANLPSLVALEGIEELVVVDDGSTDETAAVVTSIGDPRLRYVRLARNGGAPAARNAGLDVARGSWIMLAEDDCRFPRDYALVLRDEAEAYGADIVGAPIVHGRDARPAVAPAADVHGRARARRDLDEVAGFRAEAVVTPFLQAPVLARRPVFDAVRFDTGYGGNAYREETDLFIRAVQAGFVCLLTPRTYFWEPRRWEGGNVLPTLAAEYWTARNNWRFLHRHGRWLAARGAISCPVREQAAFLLRRATWLARR